MKEESYKAFDFVIKIVTTIAIVIGFVWGAVQYFDTKRQEYNMQLWNKKMDYYLHTSSAVAKIATSESVSQVKEEIDKFWSLYYGPMAVLEDSNVKNKMEKVAGFVSEYENKNRESDAKTRIQPNIFKEDPDFMKSFRNASYALAKEMQISLEQSRTKPFNLAN